VQTLRPTIDGLSQLTPDLSRSFQALEYLTNELNYNPNKGDNQGFMFWLSWFVHNFNSVVSSGDAKRRDRPRRTAGHLLRRAVDGGSFRNCSASPASAPSNDADPAHQPRAR